MRRLVLLLLTAAGFVAPALGLETGPEPVQAVTGPGQRADIAARLNAFVAEARDEGLLAPVDPEPGDGADEPQAGRAAPPPARAAPRDLRPRARDAAQPDPDRAEPEPAACRAAEDPLFLAYRDIETYADLTAFAAGLQSADGATRAASEVELAGAFLALGLTSEAAQRAQAGGGQASLVGVLAGLIENRQPPDLNALRRLADCTPDARVWLAIGLLADGQAEGARQLDAELGAFRKLPLKLRAQAAGLVVPELLHLDQRDLAERVMATFSDEERAGSATLAFNQALIGVARGDTGALAALKGALRTPGREDSALAALLGAGQAPDGAAASVLLDETLRRMGQLDTLHAMPASRRFAFDQLTRRADYPTLIGLWALPALQAGSVRDELQGQFVASLQADLAASDMIRNLAALDGLIAGQALLEGAPERAALFADGVALARRHGLYSLGESLALRADAVGLAGLQSAARAFQRGDHDVVYDAAGALPGDPAIGLLAALAAIRDKNPARLRRFEKSIDRTPETLLAMIEEDAASGHWMLGDDIYRAAGGLTGPGEAERAQRVLALRAQRGHKPSRKPLTMAQAATLLGIEGRTPTAAETEAP